MFFWDLLHYSKKQDNFKLLIAAFYSNAVKKDRGGKIVLMHAENAQRQVTALLLEWCDALVRLQVDQPDNKRLDGGIS